MTPVGRIVYFLGLEFNMNRLFDVYLLKPTPGGLRIHEVHGNCYFYLPFEYDESVK